MEKKREYKKQVEIKESKIKDLEKRLEKLEQGETKQMQQVLKENRLLQNSLNSTRRELEMVKLNQSTLQKMTDDSVTHRDEEVELLKQIIELQTTKINQLSSQIENKSDITLELEI